MNKNANLAAAPMGEISYRGIEVYKPEQYQFTVSDD